MAGGGRRKSSNRGGNNCPRNQRASGSRFKSIIFADAGVLPSFSSSPDNTRSELRTGKSSRGKLSRSSRGSDIRWKENFGYVYPVVELQSGACEEPSTGVSNDDKFNASKGSLVEANVNDAFLKSQTADYECRYEPIFTLGDNAHKGLGFFEEDNKTGEGSSGNVQNESDDTKPTQLNSVIKSTKKNSAFISIGGVKLYTHDISDGTSSDDDGSSECSESCDFRNGDELNGKGLNDSDSDIDEELFEDYLEGIGGSENVFEAKWLLENELDDSEGESSSSSGFDEMMQRLGGIALQEASMEYGMQTPQNRKISSMVQKDDLMLMKGTRSFSTKKKYANCMPQSWPMADRRGRNSKIYPGAKKKHRKEMINVKRRERMLNRGVDLEKINMKMEQIVLDDLEIFSFPPMHPRDCSQLRRLAAIYRLRSGCQGSGKKRFVTVTKSEFTRMPSASDKIRLEKLLCLEDDDSAVHDTQPPSNKPATNKSGKNRGRKHGAKEMANSKPVAFVSSGILKSEVMDFTKDSAAEINKNMQKVGAFELHTKGFGSKMLARMGYVEGEGLGKDGQGISQPIGVVQRPKSLGLGYQLCADDDQKEGESKGKSVIADKQRNFAAFENHTRGFGSKMMAKMGFVDGMGLGKDNQGIANPLTAVRLPKSRGLGAN